MFKVGQEIPLPVSGRTARVERFIGEGGQGSVFEVTFDDGSPNQALKWYFPATGTEQQRLAIESLVRRGAPTSRFLWPSEVVDSDTTHAFGYLMPLRPAEFVTLASLLKGRVEVRSAIRTTLCRDLAHSFLNLHSQGLCYRDISFANIFLDPMTGRTLICDNDNVAIDDGSPSPVLGTRKFMAPEIVRGEAEPSTVTDLWSLSVLLFYILVVGHPLLGRRELEFPTWDEDAEVVMFGREPVFVFHPTDDRNRPDPDHHGPMTANWETLTSRVRELFTSTFTDGVFAGNRRVRESIWQRAMSGLEDSIMLCPRCGAENFFDPKIEGMTCWACARPLGTPMRLQFTDGRWVAMSDATRLWSHHVSRIPNYDFETPVAEVVRHPDRQVWGLRNLSDQPWRVKPPNGDEVAVEPGRAFGLVPGTLFRFGETEATLET
jgi:serine/threonine protein kinase